MFYIQIGESVVLSLLFVSNNSYLSHINTSDTEINDSNTICLN